MGFRQGDRVRIKNPLSEYTGCRGTVIIDATAQPSDVVTLGHFVAIDGENGRTRPFLVTDLEPLRAMRVSGAGERERQAPTQGD
jgi:hypothetical protein